MSLSRCGGTVNSPSPAAGPSWSVASRRAVWIFPMFTVRVLMPRALQTRRLSSISACSPSGSMTPKTFSAPRARAQSAAVTVESLPPEMPTTARLNP